MSVWETTTVQSIVTVLTLLVAIIALASLDIKMTKARDMSAMVCQNTCISNYIRGFSNETACLFTCSWWWMWFNVHITYT